MVGRFRKIAVTRCLTRCAGAAAAVMLSTGLVAAVAQAQQASHAAATSADPASLPDQELGRRFTVKPEDLPPPHTGPVVASRSLVVPYAGQAPRVPEGFTATPFAVGLAHPRRLLVLPNGDVIVAEQKMGYLTLLRDQDGDGKADWIERHAEGFNAPYGLAWRDGDVLVADQDGIWRVPHRIGALRPGRNVEQRAADVPPDQRKPTPHIVGEEMITKKGVFGIVQGHANRHLAIDPKTGALFVGVGSSGNIGVEPEVKATIQRFEADGSGQTTYASGMRNPTALAFHPDTGDLYALVQERDGLGDRLVPDFMTRVEKGAFYGWPYSYIGKNPQPGFATLRPDQVQAAVVPDLLFEVALVVARHRLLYRPAVSRGVPRRRLRGPQGLVEQVGADRLQGRARAVQGWPPAGPVRELHDRLLGRRHRSRRGLGKTGRPAVAKDGSLLVADDTGGTIWRISYTGAKK